jgi:diketogulonate reductase-like aldo/keto reductase
VALAQQGVARDRLFLQTKFTPTNGQDHRTPYDASATLTTQVTQSFDSSLAHLHTGYLDSYVLHGPYQRQGLGAADWEVWAAIEELYRSGKTKMIGISNVTAEQLAQLCARAAVKPMMVQNRCYAALGWDKEVRELCRTHDIIYQGFSLLTANREVFADPGIRAIAQRLGTGLPQVVFGFAMQIGMLPLTGTTNPQHMKDDLQAEQLTLTAEDMQVIETIGM